MSRSLSTTLIFCILCHVTHQSSNVPPPIETIRSALDLEVNEKEDQQIDLNNNNPLITCVDEDPTRAFIQSVSPSSPCGKKCFMLKPCGGSGNSSDFCLIFLPTEGTLNYIQASRYTLTIGCTDDVESANLTTVTVTVVPNTPPTFVPMLPNNVAQTVSGQATKPGDLLYAVSTGDIDGDPVYYTMSTSPVTPYLTIGYTNGQIRATNDLKYLCESKVTATVRATDKYNPAIGPRYIDITIDPHNTPPTISNLNNVTSVNENVGAGFLVYKLGLVDDKIGTVTYRMTSVSNGGLEQYELVGNEIRTRINPNYERTDTRTATLYFDVTDGYCSTSQYSLTINIKDVNEPPILTPPVRSQIDVNEGDVVTPTGIDLVDEDLNDVHTYTKLTATSLFNVDSKSGDIYSTSTIDIDKNTVSKTYQMTYKVTDKGGLSATATVTLTVWDINDQPPYFKTNAYSFAATECTDLGTVIGTVTGDDDDSSFRFNDKIIFGGGGGKMAVMSNGDVVLTQACINGESGSGQATITDQGEYPGPLSGIPATMTLQCGPCPPTTVAPPPATATPKPATTTKATAAPTTTAKSTSSSSGGGGGITDLLAWMIPAIIGGLIWLALTAYFIYRYCFPCRNPCAGRCVRKPRAPKPAPEPKPAKAKPKPEQPKKLPPPPPPPPKVQPPPPPPPAPPEPEPDPYLFGFWKEQYTDQDHLKQPARAVKPEPIENMPPAEVVPRGNAIPPENLKLGNPGPGQWNPPKPAVPSNNGPPTVNVAPPTSIELAAIDVQLSESEKTQKNLLGGPLVTCDDEDPTRAFIQTISPTTPCGKKCFMLERCAPLNQSEFCLYYLPSEGTLKYTQASLYKLTIGCTDDVEPVATKDMTISILPNSPPVFPTMPATAMKRMIILVNFDDKINVVDD
ncbi:hypothetical protein Btru_050740 [Bulinus truncatus]|nr:hypothetical protein Btru_050740 [Bulinus truncatus]